jgi:leader peptidase (prepilin peptidase)/N-methyltransferase
MTFIEALQHYPWMVLFFTVVLGLLVGSFLNVVIYRLPVMMEKEWKQECRLILDIEPDKKQDTNETFNLAHPSSRCPHCQTPIKAWQNIPVFSYLFLKGQCHSCKTKISARYPIIEAVTGLLSFLIIWQFGATLAGLTALLFTWALISLTMIDVDHKLLPDQITLPLLWLGLIINSSSVFASLPDAVWGTIIGYLSLWSIYWLFKLLTGKEGMGYGDFKLLAALGAWMGWQALPVIILLSSLVGAIVGSIILVMNKQGRDTAIPFGPYLAAAGWIALLWGDVITQSYLQFAGFQ